MGAFGKMVSEAKAFQTGKYLQPGLHLIEVQRVKTGQTRNMIPNFIAECKVLETSNPTEHPLGSIATWYVDLTKDAAGGNIKAFFAAALGCTPEEVTQDDADGCVSEENPLAGVKLQAEAFFIDTRGGKRFTKVNWSPASAESGKAA